jgi:hypothetical protein
MLPCEAVGVSNDSLEQDPSFDLPLETWPSERSSYKV